MRKFVLTKSNTVFLLIVMIAGTFAGISPSFIIEVQARTEYRYNSYKTKYSSADTNKKYDSYEKDYAMNSYDEKSYEKEDGTIAYNKCNNVNINVNGLELNELPDSINDLATQAQADEVQDSSSFGNGRSNELSSGSDKDFECIINNNNDIRVVGDDELPSIPPELATTLL